MPCSAPVWPACVTCQIDSFDYRHYNEPLSLPTEAECMRRITFFALIFCLSLPLWAEEIVTLPTREGVTQSFLLTVPATPPAAVAVLFPGGGGRINLRMQNGRIRFGAGNFLVRSRRFFVEGGVATAVMDTPSDQRSGMDDYFRLGEEHTQDIRRVVADLKQRFPGLAVFLVGTSRGTISAAAAGRALGNEVTGTVLTSTLFYGGQRFGPGLSGVDFGTIRTPVLLVHHIDDGCSVTPYREAKNLSSRFPLITVHGGDPPRSEPCEAFSQHGFLGKEAPTVNAIIKWMLKKPYPAEID